MSRTDCISNRNVKIVAAYLRSKLWHSYPLFDDLPYPTDRYGSPDLFFLNEDEWTTYENFQKIIRRAKEISGERYFYFNCGASSASMESWGRFHYFVRVFASPDDGFKRIPFFNQNFNDIKDIDVIVPPSYDKASGKIRTLLTLKIHDDIDVHKEYVGDPYTRGIIASIPTIWGLPPAEIKQPLKPYNPEILFNEEPEFACYGLEVRMEEEYLTIKAPTQDQRKIVGKKIIMEPERVNGKKIFIGRYRELQKDDTKSIGDGREGILITQTVQVDNRVILKEGEIFKAPYFILDITYNRFSFMDRFGQIFHFRRTPDEQESGLIETINQLRETMEARNEAYRALEKANEELKEAKKYDELRRYLSPKLTEKILSSGDTLGAQPQRKMMTVVFSDIRGFSTLTDNLEPEEIFHLLDRYLDEMTKIIHQYDGTLNKIIGDGLLIFFGDPIPMEDHAKKAVLMAVDMQKKVAAELRDEWLQYGYELGIGIGINTGYMTVGNIGSDIHRDYTVIGNQVNVAARLESQAKAGQILISQRTYSRVKDAIQVEKIGEIQVKGINSPVMTYNVKIN